MDLKASAADMGRGIARGEIDPVALTEAMLDAAANNPAAEDVYARMMPTRARAEAEAAAQRARNNVRRGPLDGVPISWKDLFDTANVATESGSKLLAARIPTEDAEVLKRASGAGLVCLGKTHQTELAFSGLGINIRTATPPNAISPNLAPGGSSSGAAVSTGLGLAAAGIGSDTGGSVRIPAAWNDLVGLKTAHGDLPLTGVVPLCPLFDTVGPLCRTVEDTALVFAALAAQKPVDLQGSDVAGMRFLVLEGIGGENAPQAAFETTLSRLSDQGATLEQHAIPAIKEALSLSGVLYTTEAYATWGTAIEASADTMAPLIRERFEAGKEHSGVAYARAWQTLHTLRQAYFEATAGYDAVLLPTAPILPPDREQLLRDDKHFVERNLLALSNTRIGNLMGLAAMTMPTGTPHCGIMAMVAPHHTNHLLRVGAAIEKALSA